jgi:hypothetical protein
MPVFPIVGPPGATTPVFANFRRVFEGTGIFLDLPGGVFIDGFASSDVNNTLPYNLEAGTMMGIEGAAGANPGYWANSIIGVTSTAIVGSSSTTVTVTAAQAVELNRRIGASGYFVITGPATANGTLHSEIVTYSAVNVTTGVITISTTTNAYTANSYIGANDGSTATSGTPVVGSWTPISFIPDGSGITVVDQYYNRVQQVQWYNVPVGGVIATPGSAPNTGLLFYPTDTTLINWVQTSMSTLPGGKFIWMATFSR